MLRRLKAALVVTGLVAAGVLGGVVVADAQSSGTVTDPSTFQALSPPVRVMDTRLGIGTTATRLGPLERRTIDLTARLAEMGLPDATAVVLTVTVEAPTTASYLAVVPSGSPAGATSNLNFATGWTIASQATTALNVGRFDVFNAAGSTDVVVDLGGVFSRTATPGEVSTDEPSRGNRGRGRGRPPG